MNYLWEVVKKAREEGIDEDTLKYRVSKSPSPYLEISQSFLNQSRLYDREIEVNPYLRFYSIFRDLYAPEMKECKDLRESLTNLLFHVLAENDINAFMTKDAYYKRLLLKDIRNGVFGTEAWENLELFTREEREIILDFFLRQYRTGSSLEIFHAVMNQLMDGYISYSSNEENQKLLIYVKEKQGERIEGKLKFLIENFLDLKYTVEIYYVHHFGIIGVEETMLVDEIAVY